METETRGGSPRILLLATSACAYPGADNVGQIHAEYPTNVYVLRVPAPVVFPESFYLDCFERRGIDGIIAMSCGHECPYPNAYHRLAERVGAVHGLMKERGIDAKRLRLCAICTVCSRAFLKEVDQVHELLARLGPVVQEEPKVPEEARPEAPEESKVDG